MATVERFLAAVGGSHGQWPAGRPSHARHQLRAERDRGLELPCTQSADSRAERTDAVWGRAAHTAAAGAAGAIWPGRAVVGGGDRFAVDATSAANRSGDVRDPARRIVDGPVLPANALLFHPRRGKRGEQRSLWNHKDTKAQRRTEKRQGFLCVLAPSWFGIYRRVVVCAGFSRLPAGHGHQGSDGDGSGSRAALRPDVCGGIIPRGLAAPPVVASRLGRDVAAAGRLGGQHGMESRSDRGIQRGGHAVGVLANPVRGGGPLPGAGGVAPSTGVRIWRVMGVPRRRSGAVRAGRHPAGGGRGLGALAPAADRIPRGLFFRDSGSHQRRAGNDSDDCRTPDVSVLGCRHHGGRAGNLRGGRAAQLVGFCRAGARPRNRHRAAQRRLSQRPGPLERHGGEATGQPARAERPGFGVGPRRPVGGGCAAV